MTQFRRVTLRSLIDRANWSRAKPLLPVDHEGQLAVLLGQRNDDVVAVVAVAARVGPIDRSIRYSPVR